MTIQDTNAALRWTAAALQSLADSNLRESSTFTIDGVKKPLRQILDEANTALAATPSSRWHRDGQSDPHVGRYDCERAALSLGSLTDDELANGAFLNYDRKWDIAAVMARTPGYHPPIAWMTAVKDRIRWLSRSLERAIAAAAQQQPAPALDDTARERVRAAISAALGEAYDCTRVWDAWRVGTMSQNDFSLIAEDNDRVAEITDAAIAAMTASQSPGQAEAGEVACPGCGELGEANGKDRLYYCGSGMSAGCTR